MLTMTPLFPERTAASRLRHGSPSPSSWHTRVMDTHANTFWKTVAMIVVAIWLAKAIPAVGLWLYDSAKMVIFGSQTGPRVNEP